MYLDSSCHPLWEKELIHYEHIEGKVFQPVDLTLVYVQIKEHTDYEAMEFSFQLWRSCYRIAKEVNNGLVRMVVGYTGATLCHSSKIPADLMQRSLCEFRNTHENPGSPQPTGWISKGLDETSLYIKDGNFYAKEKRSTNVKPS